MNEPAPVHHAARRRGCVAARGARAREAANPDSWRLVGWVHLQHRVQPPHHGCHAGYAGSLLPPCWRSAPRRPELQTAPPIRCNTRILASRNHRRWGLARPARLRNSRALSPSIDLVFAGRTTTALDEKLELCRLLYREFTRLSALQYLINVNCRTATDRQTVYSIRQKRAWH